MTTVTDAPYWQSHPVTAPVLADYLAGIADPHRDWLVEAVETFRVGAEPLNVLEAGCHCGVVLRRLEALRNVQVAGVDVNPQAVDLARRAGLLATVGVLPGCLSEFEDGCVDVLVSSYCLAYLSPYDLVVALCHGLRIATRGLVIVEPMAGAGLGAMARDDASPPEWRHDYFVALDSAVANLRRFQRPCPTVAMTRVRKGPFAGITGVVIARAMWPPPTT